MNFSARVFGIVIKFDIVVISAIVSVSVLRLLLNVRMG